MTMRRPRWLKIHIVLLTVRLEDLDVGDVVDCGVGGSGSPADCASLPGALRLARPVVIPDRHPVGRPAVTVNTVSQSHIIIPSTNKKNIVHLSVVQMFIIQ